MTPTNELRFVKRVVDKTDEWDNPPHIKPRKVRVLQQKWVDEHDKFSEGEWRDVPLVKEGA